MVRVGIVGDMHGICGPLPLWNFVRGLDELWIVGHIGTKECLECWKGFARNTRFVVSDEEFDKNLLSFDKILEFEIEGHNVLMAHKGFQNKDTGYAFADKAVTSRLSKICKKTGKLPDIIVSGYSHEFAVRMDDRFDKYKLGPFLMINPGAVTPISHNECTAVRFELSEKGLSNVEKFSMEVPVAVRSNPGSDDERIYAFINESVVTGAMVGFFNK